MAFSLRTWVLGDRWNLTSANDLEARISNGMQVAYATVASAATTMVIPVNAGTINVTGTTTITSIPATFAGHRITLIFASTAQVTDGGNLKLSANSTGAADRTLTLVCDGTNWFEAGRSAN